MIIQFNAKSCIKDSIKTAKLILIMVIPYYLLAEFLLYFDLMQYVSFIFTPISQLLNLPNEAALAIAAGIFLNLYAAIAFATPLNLTAFDWTVLGLFLGVLHSIPVESTIVKKLGISWRFSVLFRVVMAFVIVLPLTLLPATTFFDNPDSVSKLVFQVPVESSIGFWHFLTNKLLSAIILSVQIIALITIVIFINEFIKNLKILQKFNSHLTLTVTFVTGFLIGITYGSSILLNESKNLTKAQMMAVCCFLMVCHAIIEDPLLFVMFGANIYILVIFRLVLATIVSFVVYFWYSKK